MFQITVFQALSSEFNAIDLNKFHVSGFKLSGFLVTCISRIATVKVSDVHAETKQTAVLYISCYTTGTVYDLVDDNIQVIHPNLSSEICTSCMGIKGICPFNNTNVHLQKWVLGHVLDAGIPITYRIFQCNISFLIADQPICLAQGSLTITLTAMYGKAVCLCYGNRKSTGREVITSPLLQPADVVCQPLQTTSEGCKLCTARPNNTAVIILSPPPGSLFPLSVAIGELCTSCWQGCCNGVGLKHYVSLLLKCTFEYWGNVILTFSFSL